MSLIEKAAQRLEQLRRAGVEVEPVNAEPGPEASPTTAVTERVVSPERLASSEPAVQTRQTARAAEVTAQFVRFGDPGYFYRNITAHMNENSLGLPR